MKRLSELYNPKAPAEKAWKDVHKVAKRPDDVKGNEKNFTGDAVKTYDRPSKHQGAPAGKDTNGYACEEVLDERNKENHKKLNDFEQKLGSDGKRKSRTISIRKGRSELKKHMNEGAIDKDAQKDTMKYIKSIRKKKKKFFGKGA
jgi:hypothetical protein